MSTRVIDETTLRIYFSKASNADALARGKSTLASVSEDSNIHTVTKAKAEINRQGLHCN